MVVWAFLGGAMPVFSMETVKEPGTKIEFPVIASFRYQGAEHVLRLTGAALRRKFFFKIYAMAHYMEDGKEKSSAEALHAVLTDGKAKQIVIEYVRFFGGDKMRDTLREGFQKNTTPAEYREIRPVADPFCDYFGDKAIRNHDRAVLRWLAGGTVVAIFNGKEIATIRNRVFARALWSIWFGDQPVVNRERLIQRMIQGP